MYVLNDTIVALATIPGKSALNIVRISGSLAVSIYRGLTNKDRLLPNPNLSHVVLLKDSDGEIIDQSMVVFFKSPQSFTGEDMLEITVHGGFVITKQLLMAIYKLGAREASPGEFTYRAFINNKMDLIQAEAIKSLSSSSSSIDNYYHLNSLLGSFSKKINAARNDIKRVLVSCEHALDFDEGEIDSAAFLNKKTKDIKNIIKNIKTIVGSSVKINSTSSLNRVAIVGYPNAGKSSLYNLLVGENKSIVTKTKGTTRDSLESSIWVDNHNVVLIDTAGIRKSQNHIETLGIEKTYEQIYKASIVLLVDEKNPLQLKKKLGKKLNNKKTILILNKVDINKKQKTASSTILFSCKDKTGLSKLLTMLSTCISSMSGEKSIYANSVNDRQLGLLNQILSGLSNCVDVEKSNDLALYASRLSLVINLFEALLFPKSKDEIINEVFEGFCVGK